MAKIKFGMMMTDARGKLGGQVFTKGRSGAMVRTKVTPINPKTPAQVGARNILASLSSDWSNVLTQAQRDSWISAAAGIPLTNVFGDVYYSTGKNYFVASNSVILQSGGTEILDAPVLDPVPYVDVTGAIVDKKDNSINLGADNDPLTGDWTYQVDATALSSPGKTNFSGAFRTIGYFQALGRDNGIEVGTAYIEKFGALLVGKKVGFRIRAVNSVTGQQSTASILSAVVIQSV